MFVCVCVCACACACVCHGLEQARLPSCSMILLLLCLGVKKGWLMFAVITAAVSFSFFVTNRDFPFFYVVLLLLLLLLLYSLILLYSYKVVIDS